MARCPAGLAGWPSVRRDVEPAPSAPITTCAVYASSIRTSPSSRMLLTVCLRSSAPLPTAASTSRASNTRRGTVCAGRGSGRATASPPGATRRSRSTGAYPSVTPVHPQTCQDVDRLGGDAVAAGLVAGKVGAVEQQHPRAGAGGGQGGGGAGRAGADHGDVEMLRSHPAIVVRTGAQSKPGRQAGTDSAGASAARTVATPRRTSAVRPPPAARRRGSGRRGPAAGNTAAGG